MVRLLIERLARRRDSAHLKEIVEASRLDVLTV